MKLCIQALVCFSPTSVSSGASGASPFLSGPFCPATLWHRRTAAARRACDRPVRPTTARARLPGRWRRAAPHSSRRRRGAPRRRPLRRGRPARPAAVERPRAAPIEERQQQEDENDHQRNADRREALHRPRHELQQLEEGQEVPLGPRRVRASVGIRRRLETGADKSPQEHEQATTSVADDDVLRDDVRPERNSPRLRFRIPLVVEVPILAASVRGGASCSSTRGRGAMPWRTTSDEVEHHDATEQQRQQQHVERVEASQRHGAELPAAAQQPHERRRR